VYDTVLQEPAFFLFLPHIDQELAIESRLALFRPCTGGAILNHRLGTAVIFWICGAICLGVFLLILYWAPETERNVIGR
jgi:hypothetical protein